MRFGITLLRAVELGLTTRACGHRQPETFQLFDQGQTRGVHRCRILQGCFGLALNLGEQIGLVLQEHLDRQDTLLAVARLAGQAQVADPIRTTLALGLDVFDLQGQIFLLAISALMLPLQEQVFPDFVPGQGALLILDTLDVGGFQKLRVEAYLFDRNGGDRHHAPHFPSEGQYVVDPGTQRGCQPTGCASAVVEPCGTITSFP
jgi:hypothetical protein